MPCRSPLSFVGWDQRSASPTSSMPQNSRIRFVRGADNDFMFHSRLSLRERSVCVRYFRGAKGDSVISARCFALCRITKAKFSVSRLQHLSEIGQ